MNPIYKTQFIQAHSHEKAQYYTNLFLISNEMSGAEVISIQHSVTHTPAERLASREVYTVMVVYKTHNN